MMRNWNTIRRGITVTKQPKKTVYETGSIFDPDGLEVKDHEGQRKQRRLLSRKTITDYDYDETAELDRYRDQKDIHPS